MKKALYNLRVAKREGKKKKKKKKLGTLAVRAFFAARPAAWRTEGSLPSFDNSVTKSSKYMA
jgi:hypothetical protein